MKKLFLLLIVISTFLAGGFWWLQNSPIDQTGVHPTITIKSDDIAGDQVSDVPETTTEQVLGKKIGVAVEQKFAKNIVFVPANDLDSPDSEEQFESEFQQLAKQMVKSSLQGAVEDSIQLGLLMNQCSAVPRNEAQIQNRLQATSNRFRSARKWNFGNSESISFDSFDEYEAYMREKYDECRATRSIFRNDLHEQIARLAAKGNKMARYLYAMWPPSLGSRFRGDKMPEWLEYQSLALEYTWQNIEAGEPLGLLAFAQSFRNNGGGFFTPTNLRYSEVLFLAAKKCGLESPWLDTVTSKYIVDLSVEINGQKLERTEIRADEIKALFCR